jgi:NitT/TauT family transport system ATP-binding protein
VLKVAGLGVQYGSGKNAAVAIAQVDFTVEQHEFVCIVGPSGCGKTTLLKCIAGLIKPTTGQAVLNGRVVQSPPPDLAVVFQDYSRSLFPWLSVHKNVWLPLRGKAGIDKDKAVSESLAAVGLSQYADRYPWQLSGGMQQRVAIARALACRPSVLLMDEPFASVDALSRSELEDLVLLVRSDFGGTVLLVTHDIDEAVYMADRVIVLSKSPATIQQILPIPLDRPREQIKSKGTPEFAELRTHVYKLIAGDKHQSGRTAADAEDKGSAGALETHPNGAQAERGSS